MMFRNICAYRITSAWTLSAAELEAALTAQAFQPIGNMDMESVGWTSPRENGQLVHACQRQLLIQLTTETKILPSTVINEAVKKRAAELEEQQGFKPGRKQMKELRDTVTDELLPRAFSRKTSVRTWIDPVSGWVVIDTAAAARADHVFKCLLKSLESLPFASLRTERTPLAAMTDWLAADEAPVNFTVDRDTELRGTGEGKATVRYVNHTLEPEDVKRHIAGGKQCTKLAMTWADRISFVLTENLMLKRVAPLDVLRENPAAVMNEDERFDADFLLMAGEYSKLLGDLVTALGGFEQQKKAA